MKRFYIPIKGLYTLLKAIMTPCLVSYTRGMSRTETPTDNGAKEAINGWVKEELLTDFKIKDSDVVLKTISEYVTFFNNERPAYALGYKTPKQVKDEYFKKKSD